MALFLSIFHSDPLSYGQKVCAAVGFWIRNFPVHFQYDANPQLYRLLERLKKLAVANNFIPLQAVDELLDISSIPSYAWLRNPSARNPPLSSTHHQISSFCLIEHWSAEETAKAMSNIEHKVLSRISTGELKQYIKIGKISSETQLERSIASFNCFSGWVQATILLKRTPQERASVIEKFIKVAKCLRQQNNFNTLMAGAITHSNIARHTQTQSLLSSTSKKELNSLTLLLSANNNYANYRKALREANQHFRIPIMGVHLKDLIAFWHSANLEQFEETRKISERCLSQLAYLLSNFLSVNRTPPNFGNANSDLINALKKVLFDTVYNEHELYNLSLKREPKAHDNELFLNINQNNNNITSHSAIDIRIDETKEKQIKIPPPSPKFLLENQKNKQQPFIDLDDFEKFISEFNLKNKQKPSTSTENGLNKQEDEIANTRHKWIEWHFLTPTNCFNCNKKLWMRYGSRCSRCLIFVHDHCKEKLLNSLECRRQQRPPLQHQQHLQEENEIKIKQKETINNSNKKSITTNYMTGWMNALLSPRFETLGPSSFFGTTRTGNYTQRSGGRFRTSSSSDAPSREALNQNISYGNDINEKTIQEQGNNGKRLRTFCKLMGSKTSGTAREKCRQQRSAEIICTKSSKHEIKKGDSSTSAESNSRVTSSLDQKTSILATEEFFEDKE
uniref:Phorbol-ester/DAG-type domain-containing protein n=1 Tax=Meloidogyne hapla TaxID=6305 RepID=A0A1I8BHY4_MELHA